MVLGNIISIGVLFNVTKNLKPILAFSIISATLVFIAVVSFLMLKEPNY
jgi:hypothetical protein